MEAVRRLMEWAKQSNPSLYWETRESMARESGECHFDEEYARHKVSGMYHTNQSGSRISGEHWSIEQVRSVRSSHSDKFSEDDTCWDLYVALHIWWHDLECSYKKRQSTEQHMIDDSIEFFFCDEDYEGECKVFDYCMMAH